MTNATADDVDPTSRNADRGIGFGIVPSMVTQLVAALSQTSNAHGSGMGDAFVANINSSAIALNTSTTDPSTIFRAIEASVESIVDDVLLAYSSAQLMVAGNARPERSRRNVPVLARVAAVQIGDKTYVRLVSTISAALLLIAVLEMVRT